ncbi:MAG: tRNA guanosine(34) transglycosylase Tgt [Planctomycetota bacterium]
MIGFEVEATCGKARLGRLITPHGAVATPAFMPVGTAGSVKGITPDQLRTCGAQMLLGNTYHLMLRPGAETVRRLGGLHAMMGWSGPLLTDSGGYQVFSLAHLRRIDDEGVVFRSHVDGAEVALTPERAVDIQRALGADVIMQLDECPPADAPRDAVAVAVARSAAWALRCRDAWDAAGDQALFGIQQGGVFDDLRADSARRLVELDLPGYAIGGLSVGEGHHAMTRVLDATDGQFPADRPRYLMGVGEPRDILAAVARGVDMFDCVLPTRNGRNAQAFTRRGRIRLRNARWAQDAAPIEPGCDCYTCRNFSRGTLRHLFAAGEMLAPTLTSIHNLRFFARLMGAIREAIVDGTLANRAPGWVSRMYAEARTTG